MRGIELEKVKVIYIVGTGRSGSTILEELLATHKDIFNAGELIHTWERGFEKNYLCGCGRLCWDCPIWGDIKKDLEQRLGNGYITQIKNAFKTVNRFRYFFPLLLKGFRSEKMESLLLIQNFFLELYLSIQKNTQKTIIVDSSKSPVLLFILSLDHRIDLHIIHIVRDPRGVTYSNLKRKYKKIKPDIEVPMHSSGLVESSILWMVTNFYIEILKFFLKNKRFITVRYEDFALHPARTITNIFLSFGINQDNCANFDEDNLHLMENHTISGNPVRFNKGRIKIYLDEQWKSNMSFLKKHFVTLSTFPLRWKYKYH